jgi:hypothetical protein
MATRTLGTNGTATLTAIPFMDLTSATPDTDIAAISQAIKTDTPITYMSSGPGSTGVAYPSGTVFQLAPGESWSKTGRLIIPGRGILYAQPGDWVAVDANGWPILLSGLAIAGVTTTSPSSWTHSGNLT